MSEVSLTYTRQCLKCYKKMPECARSIYVSSQSWCSEQTAWNLSTWCPTVISGPAPHPHRTLRECNHFAFKSFCNFYHIVHNLCLETISFSCAGTHLLLSHLLYDHNVTTLISIRHMWVICHLKPFYLQKL